MGDIPRLVRLTMYGSNPDPLSWEELQNYINNIEKGKIKLVIDRVFKLDNFVQAHQYLESNQGRGKVVVLTFISIKNSSRF
jgi:NADPH:quinone reductase-like Zn-dependent oxidoreductase